MSASLAWELSKRRDDVLFGFVYPNAEQTAWYQYLGITNSLTFYVHYWFDRKRIVSLELWNAVALNSTEA